MDLKRFRVTNYRSVIDSGWIDADPVTALIGINESGKTNLLLPLWKLNPAGEGEIKPTSDYPKSNYAAIRADPASFVFITAEFSAPELARRLMDLTGLAANLLDPVHVSRAFDGTHSVEFPNHNPAGRVPSAEIGQLLEEARRELSAITALGKEAVLKPAMLERLVEEAETTGSFEGFDPIALDALAERLNAVLPDTTAATSSIVPRYRRLLEAFAAVRARLVAIPPGNDAAVVAEVVSRLPTFVYYSNYGNLDSEIYLPHVVENLGRDDLGAKELAKARTLRVLFSFVQLQPDEILALGRDVRTVPNRAPTQDEVEAVANRKRDRTILLNSAGTDLTKRFREWWKQGDYTFEFQADGDHFRIWVSDLRRPEKVELEDRSTGLQWFLSFYLVFLVESSAQHSNAILLLDEPGLSLHPLAQKDLSDFFENLGRTNQIIYTTHSPFLVDADMLDRARKVFIAADGSTKASSDLRRGNEDPRKSGATYAIYSALNMNVAESILLGCHPVIVEGPSDQHYLSTIKTLLIAAKRLTPRREIVFPPSHGAKNAKVIASILSGRSEVLPFILLDGDAAGRQMARDLQNGIYQGDKARVLSTDDCTNFKESEIEDLFPAEFIADVVDRWERGAETEFSAVFQAGRPIVPQILAWAASQDLVLPEGWKVDVARLVKTRALGRGPDAFDAEVLTRWAALFERFSGAA